MLSKIKTFFLGSGLLVLACAAIVGSAEVYTVVADAPLPIRRIANQPNSSTNTIRTLLPSEQVIVIACIDYKSDVAVQVRVAQEEMGYVSNGTYRLKREGRPYEYLFSDPQRLIWSCWGFFESRKFN